MLCFVLCSNFIYGIDLFEILFLDSERPAMPILMLVISYTINEKAVGAASQRWSNERIRVYFKLMMVKCSLMMVK